MVGSTRESLSCCFQCVMKLIVGIIHLINLEDRLQASFIKPGIVSYQWQTFYQWFNLFPDLWEYRCIHRVLLCESMDVSIPIAIVIWFRLNE